MYHLNSGTALVTPSLPPLSSPEAGHHALTVVFTTLIVKSFFLMSKLNLPSSDSVVIVLPDLLLSAVWSILLSQGCCWCFQEAGIKPWHPAWFLHGLTWDFTVLPVPSCQVELPPSRPFLVCLIYLGQSLFHLKSLRWGLSVTLDLRKKLPHWDLLLARV